MNLCYVSFSMIPLSDAVTIGASAPVFVSIIAYVVLKEECGIFQVFSVFITIIGVLLISRPTFIFGQDVEIDDSTRMEGIIAAIISCIMSALVFISIRKLQKTPSIVVINAYAISCLTFALIMSCLFHFYLSNGPGHLSENIQVPDTWTEIAWLVFNGLCVVLAQLCLTVSLKVEEAGLVSLARTADIIVAFILQLIFLNEKIQWTSFLGALIIFIIVGISGLRKWLGNKPNKGKVLWIILNCGLNQNRGSEA